MLRSSAFTASVARRYQFGVRPWEPMGMPLVTLVVAVRRDGDHYNSTTSFVFEPRLRVALVAPVERLHRIESPRVDPARAMTPEPRLVRPAGEAARDVAQVLRRRETRIDALPERADLRPGSQPAAAGPALPLPALPLVSLRPARAGDGARDPLPESPRPIPAAAAVPAPPRAAPPLELARITEAVMSTLNRRLAAERERVGRR